MIYKNIKCTLAYDGSCYLGWQRTETGPSIEGELLLTLRQILQEEVRLFAASRTDAGVHAAGQVCNFFTARASLDVQKLKMSLNSLLPKDIVVWHCEEADPSFHATLQSKSKEYHYQLCWDRVQMPSLRHFSWHYPSELNLPAMRSAARQFLGTHDFSAFCNLKKYQQYDNYTRSLWRIDLVELENKRLRFEIEGDHFLYKMVRNLVGTLVYVGCGKLEEAGMKKILIEGRRTEAGMTAPAHGLSLQKVNYA